MSLRRLFSCVFLLLISVPFIVRFAIKGDASEQVLKTDNRLVTPYQKLVSAKGKDLQRYFRNLDAYISDRLIFKDEVVDWANATLTNPSRFFPFDFSRYVMGGNGFIFMGDKETNGAIITRHFSASFMFSEARMNALASDHARLAKAAEESGAPYYVFVSPNKEGIYCEDLPKWLRSAPCSRAARVTRSMIEVLNAHGVRAVYPFDALRNGKSNVANLYYKTDSHWNRLGAEIGYAHLMQVLSKDGVFVSHPYKRNTLYRLIPFKSRRVGDLGLIAGFNENNSVEDIDYALDSPVEIFWNPMSQGEKKLPLAQCLTQISAKGWSGRMKNPASTNGQRLVIIGDSFMVAMGSFFNLDFAEILYLSRHDSIDSLEDRIRQFKPDLVISEVVERSFR